MALASNRLIRFAVVWVLVFAPFALLVSVDPASAYSVRAPIAIYGNAGFTSANGVTGGDGTPGNPFVIEGWEINASTAIGVRIQDTDAHFVVRKVFVHSGVDGNPLWDGLYLFNVTNGTVVNSTFRNDYALRVASSSNIAISGNTMENPRGYLPRITSGFDLEGGSRFTVTDNNVSGQYTGINLWSVTNSTISRNRVWGNRVGISAGPGSAVDIVDNVVAGNSEGGIGVGPFSGRVRLAGNSITDNGGMGVNLFVTTNVTMNGNVFLRDGLYLEGGEPRNFDSHAITSDNLVNGLPLRYFARCRDVDVNGIPVGQLIVASCSNARFSNLTIDGAGVGAQLGFVDRVTITRSTFASNTIDGAEVSRSTRVGFFGNTFRNNSRGVTVALSPEVLVVGNTFWRNGHGIRVDDGLLGRSYRDQPSNVTIRGNMAQENGVGFAVLDADNLTVLGNVVLNNTIGVCQGPCGTGTDHNLTFSRALVMSNRLEGNGYGISLDGGLGFLIRGNNFIGNTVQAFDTRGSQNTWNAGCPSGGNYWSDYVGVDAVDCGTGAPPADGLGDTPYLIDADSADRLPSVRPTPVIVNTPPFVALSSPFSTGTLSGGSSRTIAWVASDPDDPAWAVSVDLQISTDSGQSWVPIARGLPADNGSYAWSVPFLDAPVRVRACATDADGFASCDGVAGIIDSRPPIVLRSVPDGGAAGVSTTAELEFDFDGPVNRTSAELAFSVTPNPGGISFRWERRPDGTDSLLVAHNPLDPGMEYVVVLRTVLKDASDPGNALTAPFALRFATASVTPVAAPWQWIAFATLAILLGVGLVVRTEAVRVPLLTVVLAGTNRGKGEKEESVTRGMILGFILVHPGDTYTDIKRTLNLNDGTATWHLQRLEKEALVKSRTEGSRRRYYPAGVRLPDEDGGELHEIQRRLLQAVKADPGKPVRILAEELGLSSQLTLYHLRKLASEDRVLLARRGFLLRAYSSPKATRRIP